jgi:hypothetical protein
MEGNRSNRKRGDSALNRLGIGTVLSQIPFVAAIAQVLREFRGQSQPKASGMTKDLPAS